jgi:hypothetical protein
VQIDTATGIEGKRTSRPNTRASGRTRWARERGQRVAGVEKCAVRIGPTPSRAFERRLNLRERACFGATARLLSSNLPAVMAKFLYKSKEVSQKSSVKTKFILPGLKCTDSWRQYFEKRKPATGAACHLVSANSASMGCHGKICGQPFGNFILKAATNCA